MSDPLMQISDLDASYGDVRVLQGVTLSVQPREILCVLGRNGAGKSTLMKSIMGLIPRTSGSIEMAGQNLLNLPPHQVPKMGVGYVPQGRRLFTELTVAENLEIGAIPRGFDAATRDRVLNMFPVLRDRLGQRAGTLSGGEQQMLAMGRALSVKPEVMLLDEPTEGLQPSMIQLIRDSAAALRDQGTSVILVEQRVDAVLSLADRVAFLENGVLKDVFTRAELENQKDAFARYIGVGTPS